VSAVRWSAGVLAVMFLSAVQSPSGSIAPWYRELMVRANERLLIPYLSNCATKDKH
jgi:hypothetical protein